MEVLLTPNVSTAVSTVPVSLAPSDHMLSTALGTAGNDTVGAT